MNLVSIKCERDYRRVYLDEDEEEYEDIRGFHIASSNGIDVFCDDYRMCRMSPDGDIQVTCYVYNEDGFGSVVKEFSFTTEDVFEDDSRYKVVVDICNHEDYPCCGCSHEDYPMRTERAIPLCMEGRVKILGDYVPDPIF